MIIVSVGFFCTVGMSDQLSVVVDLPVAGTLTFLGADSSFSISMREAFRNLDQMSWVNVQVLGTNV